MDWEVELAVVIGKEGKDISRETAYEYVAGYTISNDVSFRDFQSMKIDPLGLNWFKGKGMDGSSPSGRGWSRGTRYQTRLTWPLSLTVNGQQRQNARSSEMLIRDRRAHRLRLDRDDAAAGRHHLHGTPDGIAAATGGPS